MKKGIELKRVLDEAIALEDLAGVSLAMLRICVN